MKIFINIVPKQNLGGWNVPKSITVVGVSTVKEAIDILMGG